jgi:hypothetical protein
VVVLEKPLLEFAEITGYAVQKLFHGAIEHHYSVFDTSRLCGKGRLCFLDAWINNPNTIDSIFSIASDRPRRTETMNDGTEKAAPR